VGPVSTAIGAGNCEKTTAEKKLKIFLQKPPHGGFFMYYLFTVTTDRNIEGTAK
jgi:hypothetical protein